MRIAVKITLMVLCSLFGGLALFGASWVKYSELETVRNEHRENQLAWRDTLHLEATLNQWLKRVDLFFSQRQQHLASEVGRESLQLRAQLQRLAPQAPTDVPALTTHLTDLNHIVEDTAPQSPDNLAIWNQRLNEADHKTNAIMKLVDRLDAHFEQAVQQSRSAVTLAEKNMIPTLASYTMAYIMVSALLWLWMSQTLVRPLQRLQQHALRPHEEQSSEPFALYNGPYELQKLASSMQHTDHRLAETLKRTDALQAEHEQSLAHIESMMTATHDAIATLDASGNIINLNRATRDKFNLTTDAAGQTHINELIPNFVTSDTPLKPQTDSEHIGLCSDGHKFVLELTLEALDHSEGGFTLLMRDVTHKKIQQLKIRKLNEKLVAASQQATLAEAATGVLDTVSKVLQAIDASTNRLSQENQNRSSQAQAAALLDQYLRNPPLSLSSDALMEQLTEQLEELNRLINIEQDDQQQQLSQLKRELTHIRKIITTQRTLAAGNSKTEKCDVAVALDEALTMHSTRLNNQGIEVIREYQSMEILADKHALIQILVNLIHNSIDAIAEQSPINPQLRLRVHQLPDQQLGIDIIDNGIGLTAEQKQRLFRHGYTTKSTGQGLGLNSCAVAAKKMQGDLQAVSEGRGRGSLFRLQLPAAKAAKKVA